MRSRSARVLRLLRHDSLGLARSAAALREETAVRTSVQVFDERYEAGRLFKPCSPQTNEALLGQNSETDQLIAAVSNISEFFASVYGVTTLGGGDLKVSLCNNTGTLAHYWKKCNQVSFDSRNGLVHDVPSIDIVTHEIMHGITRATLAGNFQDFHDRLTTHAIDEHLSDVFGVLCRKWLSFQSGASDTSWDIGAGWVIPGPNRRAVRCLDRPGTAGVDGTLLDDKCVGTAIPGAEQATSFVEHNGVKVYAHDYSGVPSRAFAEACKAAGGQFWSTIGLAWMSSIPKLSPGTTMKEFAESTIEEASKISSMARSAVEGGWSIVGV